MGVLPLSVNCQLKTSMPDAASHTSGFAGSLSEVLAVVSDTTAHSLCTIMLCMLSLWLTTQTCSTGMYHAFCQRTHQCQMHTASGEHARTQFTTCTTRPHGDTS